MHPVAKFGTTKIFQNGQLHDWTSVPFRRPHHAHPCYTGWAAREAGEPSSQLFWCAITASGITGLCVGLPFILDYRPAMLLQSVDAGNVTIDSGSVSSAPFPLQSFHALLTFKPLSSVQLWRYNEKLAGKGEAIIKASWHKTLPCNIQLVKGYAIIDIVICRSCVSKGGLYQSRAQVVYTTQ